MITAQDIREKGFEKSKFGGYDMASVDDFLEELADDVAASQKENAVLKSKMKVLVDKIEEYRSNEEALNMAVISAQKLAVQIENEARQRAAAMLADAERQVAARVGSIEEETKKQERRLAEAKASASEFFNSIRAICNDQVKKIDAIASGIIPQPEASRPPACPAWTIRCAALKSPSREYARRLSSTSTSPRRNPLSRSRMSLAALSPSPSKQECGHCFEFYGAGAESVRPVA